MMTVEGPKVLEFNVRLGDPETQVLMHNFKGDLAHLFYDAAHGAPATSAMDAPGASACIVLASQNYPTTTSQGVTISGIEAAEALGATVFHAGTGSLGQNIVTAGGRVLGVTASADTLPVAIAQAYKAVDQIHFEGMQYRHDIGAKGLRRW